MTVLVKCSTTFFGLSFRAQKANKDRQVDCEEAPAIKQRFWFFEGDTSLRSV
jgi:hypothetical protein